jgi:hypothetical protein
MVNIAHTHGEYRSMLNFDVKVHGGLDSILLHVQAVKPSYTICSPCYLGAGIA